MSDTKEDANNNDNVGSHGKIKGTYSETNKETRTGQRGIDDLEGRDKRKATGQSGKEQVDREHC